MTAPMAKSVTIGAINTAEDVELSGATVRKLTVFNETGNNPVFVRFDGEDAETGDNGGYVIPASAWAKREFVVGPDEGQTVSIISAGTETVRIEGE